MFVRSVSFLLLKPVEMLFFSWALEKYELGNESSKDRPGQDPSDGFTAVAISTSNGS